MIKYLLISTLLVYSVVITMEKPTNISQRDKDIVYNDDGSVLFYDVVYKGNELKELNNILKNCDIEFMKRQQDNVNLSLGQIMGKTNYHNFYFYIGIDTIVGNYYSQIVVWDLNMRAVKGILVREYDRKYEINKKPYHNVTDVDRIRYLYDLKKYYSNIKIE